MTVSLKHKIALLNLLLLIPAFMVCSLIPFKANKQIIFSELKTKCTSYSTTISDCSKQSILLSDEYQLNKTIENFQKKDDILYIIITNADGKIIANSTTVKGISSFQNKIKHTIKNKKDSIGKAIEISYESQNILECLSPVLTDKENKSTLIGFVKVGLSTTKLDTAKSNYFKKSYLLITISCATIILINFAYLELLLRPLKKLSNIMDEINNGNTDIWFEAKGSGEIKKAFLSFKNMIGTLKQKITDLNRKEAALHTKIKEQNQNLSNQKKQLIQTDRLSAVKEFCSGVADNFKTPVESITNYINIIEKQLTPNLSKDDLESLKQYIATIKEELTKTTEIANNLLYTAPLETFNPAPTNMNELIEEIISELKPQFEGKKILIEQHLSEEVPKIMANPTTIRIALSHLIANALQFTKEAGEIAIYSALRKENDTEYVELRVRDTGTGISDDIAGKIFLPFFTTLKAEGHAGLGLAIADNIIRQHNAFLEYNSVKNKGTNFTIRFQV